MYISVDVGGTNIRIAGSKSLNEPSFRRDIKRHQTTNNYNEDISFILNASKEIAGDDYVEALGICIPGTLSDDKTALVSANNLAGWANYPFVQELQAKLLCDVYADHDGVAAGIGEAYYDDVPSEFAYLIWGTGIGGASVKREGEIISAAREFTWVDYFRPWETDCGGASLAKTHGKPTTDFTKDEWDNVFNTFSDHMDSFVNKTSVKHIVFGGGLAVAHTDFINGLGEKHGITTHVSKLGVNSGIYGGFGLIRKNLA